jgi:hypothetical protein
VILDCPARFNVAACGTKFGKSMGCSIWLAKEVWETPNTYARWIAPIYRQAEIGYDLLTRMLPYEYAKTNDTELKIELMNGSVIDFKSGEHPESLEGFAVDRFVLDEAAKMRQEVWDSHRTTLTATLGKGWIISTPLGRNWFYDMYLRGQDTLDKDFKSFRFVTEDNPYVTKEEIETARRTMPQDAFRQYYLAEFLEDSAGVFRKISQCIEGDFEEAKPNHNYCIGVDLAKYQDYTVLFVIDELTRHIVYFDRFSQVDWSLQKQRIYDLAHRYNKARVLVDSTGVGDPIYEDLRKLGINVYGYKFTSVSKQQLVERLITSIENKTITFPRIPELIGELESFEYEIGQSGHIKYSAPEGMHDDCVISLALANWQVENGLFQTFTEFYKEDIHHVNTVGNQGITIEDVIRNRNQGIPIF